MAASADDQEAIADAPAVAGRGPRLTRWAPAGLWAVLALGLAARLVLSFTIGHRWDIGYYLEWMRGLVTYGLAGFYLDSGIICDYPPLYVLVLRGLGAVLAWFDPHLGSEAALRTCLRLPACLADVGIALLLFAEGRRLLGRRAGVAAAALYFLNPATLYLSGFWGQSDSLHSGLVLAACVALNRRHPTHAGVAIALALLQKLQAIAFLPLVLLDVYRLKRWRGVGGSLLGFLITVVVVLTPFAATGTLRDVLTRGYVNVVGQNPFRSFYAFNVWYLIGDPGARDDVVPAFLLPVVAVGDTPLSSEHWITFFTWRRLAQGALALAVAVILAVYSRRSSPAARFLTAGLLALAFFLLPTQMHERYLFPVLAVLPLWALGNAWRERAFVLISVLFLLNLTLVLPVGEIAGHIAGLSVIVALALLFTLVGGFASTAQPATAQSTPDNALSAHNRGLLDQPETLAPSRLVSWFRRTTVVALCGVAAISIWVAIINLRPPTENDPNRLNLGTLMPTLCKQGYGRLRTDASVDGGALCLDGWIYPRGLGTHTPFELIYDLPPGYARFRATLGVNRSASGVADVRIALDGYTVFNSGLLRGSQPPIDVNIPLQDCRQLKLTGLDLGDKSHDHIDLADAHLEK